MSGPQVCAARMRLPLRVVLAALDVTPGEEVHPMEVANTVRCGLEDHEEGPHFDLVRELDDASCGEVWVGWEEGRAPECVAILPDCTADNGKGGGENDACTLFRSHPGRHSFDLVDREYEAVRAGPEFRRLADEVSRRLEGA